MSESTLSESTTNGRNVLVNEESFEQAPSYVRDHGNSETPTKSSGDKPLVISVHGIRTTGKWQKELTSVLGVEGFIYEPLDYGFFGIIKTLLPCMRRRQIEWFLDQYTRITERHRGRHPSIIAHSFGTYQIARAMQKYSQIKFDQIIFCGSIVHTDYSWTDRAKAGQVQRILNECGQKDWVVKAAAFAIKDAGPSGIDGFKFDVEGILYQRHNNEFRHSDSLYRLNYINDWVPFLKGTLPPKHQVATADPVNWKFFIFRVVLLIASFAVAGLIMYVLTRHHPPSLDCKQTMVEFKEEFFNLEEWNVSSTAYIHKKAESDLTGHMYLENMNAICFAKDLCYRNFHMVFNLELLNGEGAAWALRVKDSGNYYLFYLSGNEKRFFTYLVHDGKFDSDRPENTAAVIPLLKAGSQYRIEIDARGNEIEHKIIATDTGTKDDGVPRILGKFTTAKLLSSGSIGFRTVNSERFSVDDIVIVPLN